MPTFRVAMRRTEQAVLHIEAEDEWAAERAARRIRQPSDWTSVGAIDAWAVEVSERRVPNGDVVWAALVTKHAGYNTRLLHLTDRPTGVQYRVGDPSLLKQFYRLTVTLEQGIRRCFR